MGRAPRGRRGAGPRRAGCPRPRDHGRAQGDQAVHGGAGRDAHPRRHAAVHRGEGGRRGVAAHALEGGARARHGSAHGRDPGAGDSPDVQPEQLRRRHRRRAAQPRRHRPLRARLDVQGDPRGRRPRGGRGAPHRPLLRGERRHQGGERHDPRPEEVRLAHVLGGAPELLQRGLDQGRPLPRQGAVLQVHLRIRLWRPDGRGPDRGEPGTAPGAEAVVGTLARDHVDRPGDLGDRAPDGLGVLGRRQWRAPAAAADRPRHPRRRGPGNAARARAARRSPGHQPGDGPDAHRDHDGGGAQRHRPQCRHPRLRRRGQDGHRAEARSRDPPLLAGARRALVRGLRARRGSAADHARHAGRAEEREMGQRGGRAHLREHRPRGAALPQRAAPQHRAGGPRAGRDRHRGAVHRHRPPRSASTARPSSC